MTEPSPAVTLAHPPAALLRAANPVLSFLLRSPAAGLLGKGFMVLTFTGRKSGRRYSVPVSAHEIGGDLYAIASATWRLNFRGGGNADVVHNGKTTTMRGELVEEPRAVAELCKRSADSYGAKTAQRMMGLKFRDNTIPSVTEFEAAAKTEHLGAIRFTPAT